MSIKSSIKYLPHALISVFLILAFQNCSQPFELASFSQTSTQGEDPPIDTTIPTKLESTEMTSPNNGEESSDTTPRISGQINKIGSGSEFIVYTDKDCLDEIGASEISSGTFDISNIILTEQDYDDGDYNFYGKVVYNGVDQMECIDLQLGYSLSTNIPSSSTKRYRLSWRDDPSTTMVIGWENSNNDKDSVKIYYDTIDFGRDTLSYKYSADVSVSNYSSDMNNMFSRLKDLRPNTAYYFVIKDSKGVSERYWFKTASDSSADRLSVVAGGDSRNNRTARVFANKMVKKLRPDFVYFGGDYTSSGSSTQWKSWMDDWQNTIGDDRRIIPIVGARGNHESSNSYLVNLFDTPSNVYYALNFNGNLLRAYVLNTQISEGGTQAEWLKNDLKSNSQPIWKSAIYHVPMRPHVSSKSDNNSAYNAWAQLFYDYKVKLVVESDSHVVKSTWPVRPSSGSGSEMGFIRDDSNGIVFVGEGCWGAPIRPNDDNKEWTRAGGSFNQVKWIFIDSDSMEVRTIKVDNSSDVEQLTDLNRFKMPNNINLWKPTSGEVLTINK